MASYLHADGDWDDILVIELGKHATLACAFPEMTGDVTVKWSRRPLLPKLYGHKQSFVDKKEFLGDSSMNLNGPFMQLADINFHNSGVFSLVIVPKTGDEGLYYCLVKQQDKKERERVILLAILTGRGCLLHSRTLYLSPNHHKVVFTVTLGSRSIGSSC